MKKNFMFMVIIMMAVNLGSQEYKYINIDGFFNLPSISISSIDEYMDILKKEKITTLFLYLDKKNLLDTSVLGKGNDVYFRFSLSGYTSIEDYLKGKDQKYLNGQDYYEGKKMGFSTSAQYYYFKRNRFFKVEDAIDAFNAGFIFEKYELPGIMFPLELNDNANNIIRNYFPKYSAQTKNIYQNGKISNISQSIVSIYTLELQNSIIKEDQIFYMAKLSNLNSYSSYQENYRSRENGFIDFKDYSEASSKGFLRGNDYYKAKELGFILFSDFSIAQQLNINSPQEFENYKPIFSSIEKSKKDFQLNDDDALIYYFVSQIASGSQLSIERLSSSLNLMFSKYSKLSNYRSTYKSTLFSATRLETFLLRVNISNIGYYDKQAGIFSKK